MKRLFNISSLAIMFVLIVNVLGVPVSTAYAAGNWQTVGSAGFSAGNISFPSIATDNGTPYVAYMDDANDLKATVMKFNGTNWAAVGSAGFSADYADYISLAIDNGIPYIAYADGGNDHKATVMKFDGTNWITVGSVGFSAGTIYYTSLVIDNGTPYVAYMDGGNSYKATVMKFDGTDWVTIGSAGFSAGTVDYTSLAIDNGTPYVAYQDDDNDHKATVMKFDGTDWVAVGSAGFSAGAVGYTSLAIDNGTPYVAYEDGGNNDKATVMKFDGTNWAIVGSAGFSAGSAFSTNLALDNGTPYVAYQDNSRGGKTTVMKFDSTDWVTVGSAGFSVGNAYAPSLGIDNGIAYLAYADGGNNYKATVMKFFVTDFLVNSDQDTDDGYCNLLGQGTGNQDCTLREALNAANTNIDASEIAFAADYTITLDGSQLPAVTTEIIINGNGAAKTILQANANPGVATYRVLQLSNTGNLTLSKLSIRNGQSTGGSGVYVPQGGTLIIDKSTIYDNFAADSGGGIYNDGTLNLSNSIVSNNGITDLNTGDGGGIYNGGIMTISNSAVSGNSAPGRGGGIFNGGTLEITNSKLSGNSATDGGGIANISGGTLIVTNSTFENNSVFDYGGAIYNSGTAIGAVTNSTFSGNFADTYGGGIYKGGNGTLTVMNSTFSENTAYEGGGMAILGGTVTVTNSTFSTNSAYYDYGGGIYNNGGTLTVANSTLSGNSAPDGGGIYNQTGSTNLSNTIVVNSPSGLNCVQAGGTLTADSFNIDTDGSCGNATQMTSAQINLQPLANNGGFTQTMALGAGSLAINAGTNTSCPATDQRGVTRPQGSRCDIGAYEYEEVHFAVIGDYGYASQPELEVANLVKSWNPDFVITVGDNNYNTGSAMTIDPNIGQYYREFIYPYIGTYGAGALTNRFFPSLGNHDWDTTNAQPYLNYFALPGNERYYDYVKGPVHFFVIDSDSREPDGVSSTSVQATWLKNNLAASTSSWNIVYMHHSPYSSSQHGSTPALQWPFAAWGADAVLTGHDHTYERLSHDGIPYFVNGLGGRSIYAFGSIVTGSQLRYNADYGAMLVDANASQVIFKFISRTGLVVDTYTLPTNITGNAGVGGATLSYTDGTPKTVTADGSGNYSITVPAGWSGMVMPYKTGYTFSPVSKSYSNVQSGQTSQNYTATTCVGCADVNVTLGGTSTGNYTLPSGGMVYPRYGINGGPVHVFSTNGKPIFTSQRAVFGNSFNSIVGYPGNQLTTEYWFTSLDDLGMITYLVIGNPSTTLTAHVDVYIAGNKMNLTPYAIAPGQRVFPRYGINGGPVHVVSDIPVFTSERTKYGNSFNEVLGYPANQLTTEYWFTSLDDLGMITYLVIGNPSTVDTALVDVYIAGNKMNPTPYSIAPGQRVFPRYGINGGPVQVVSTNGVPIFTSERTKYGNSFNEVLGYPDSKLTTESWFTSLDDAGMITYLVIGNPSPALTAHVDVYIAGVKQNVTPYAIAPGQRVFPRYGINGGPVRVVSDIPIFTSERSKYQSSFNEILGIPNTELTTDYWFTSLDDLGMITYLVITAP